MLWFTYCAGLSQMALLRNLKKHAFASARCMRFPLSVHFHYTYVSILFRLFFSCLFFFWLTFAQVALLPSLCDEPFFVFVAFDSCPA